MPFILQEYTGVILAFSYRFKHPHHSSTFCTMGEEKSPFCSLSYGNLPICLCVYWCAISINDLFKMDCCYTIALSVVAISLSLPRVEGHEAGQLSAA